jgi:hypothetical protein
LTAFEGFSGTVTLTDTVPSGLICGAITPGSVTLPPSRATATLTCNASTAGNYNVTVTATSGALVHSAIATFTCSTAGVPCSSSVGGEIIPVDKLALLAPYAVVFLIAVIAATVYLRHFRGRKGPAFEILQQREE